MNALPMPDYDIFATMEPILLIETLTMGPKKVNAKQSLIEKTAERQ